MKKIYISNYQFEELNEEKIYINKYNLDFMYLYELNRYWKEFAFDILDELQLKNLIMVKQENLLTFLKNNYKTIIENNKLDIDFRDYIELNDYITLKEWLKNENNHIENIGNGVVLIVD